MTDVADLEQKLEAEQRARMALEDKLTEQMELMTTLVTTFQGASAAAQVSTETKAQSSIYVNQGRKIPVFKDKPASSSETSVQDWCMDVERHLDARGIKGEKAFSFVLEHLGGKARQEILGRDLVKDDPDKIYSVLKKVFGEGLTLGQLKTKFFSYKQQPNEDVIACSLKLVEMMADIVKRDPAAADTKEKVLRERLADAVSDETIQHELRRLIDEDESLGFFEARDRVLRWRGEVKPQKKTKEASVNEAAADSSILQALKGLTEQVGRLVESQKTQRYGSQSQRNTGTNAAGVRVCFACRSPDHLIRDCPKKKNGGGLAPEKKEELNSSAPQQ